MADALRSVIMGPDEGETLEGPVGGPLTFKLKGKQTNGALTALENVIPCGQGPPLHTHANEDESWFVLAGELRFTRGRHQARAGGLVCVCPPRHPPLLSEHRHRAGAHPRDVHPGGNGTLL